MPRTPASRSRSKSPARRRATKANAADDGSSEAGGGVAASPSKDGAISGWNKIRDEHNLRDRSGHSNGKSKTISQLVRTTIEPIGKAVWNAVSWASTKWHGLVPIAMLILLTVYDDLHNCTMGVWWYNEGKGGVILGSLFALLLCFTWKGMYKDFYDSKGELASAILLIQTCVRFVQPAMLWFSELDDTYCTKENSTQVMKEDYWCPRAWCDTNPSSKESCTLKPTLSADAIATIAVIGLAMREMWKMGKVFTAEEAKKEGLSQKVFDIIDADKSGHVSKCELEVWLGLEEKERQKLIDAH